MTGTVAQINISRGGVPKLPIPEGLVTPAWDRRRPVRAPTYPWRSPAGGAADLRGGDRASDGKGYPLFFGALGENITMRGIDHRQLRFGQRYRIGEAFMELTKVRVPCSALDVYGPSIQARDLRSPGESRRPSSPRWAMSGFYAADFTDRKRPPRTI